MEEFDNLTMPRLRDMLITRMEETYGRDYTFGWLKAAYDIGHTDTDINRDLLINEIRKCTKVKA
jgi:hypothetical protein